MESDNKLIIKSDSEDFYDNLCIIDNSSEENSKSDENALTYFRYKQYNNKIEELNVLKNLGVPTIDIVPVQSLTISNPSQEIIVYTDLSKHGGKGKILTTFADANLMYRNKMCSILRNYDGYTYKYVQVGKRRFWLVLRNNELKASILCNIQELPSQYNYQIKLPIFSIDYIFDGGKQIAVDFNSIQSLKNIGLNNVFEGVEVVEEIKNCLFKFKLQK